MSEQTSAQDTLAVGTWIGREQAFNALAHHCSAARVASLKQVRDTEAYKSLNLTWDQFCPEHAGISRVHADRLIGQLTEFGAPYFKLTDIVPVSPAAFREIAPAVSDDFILFRGESIAILPENAAKIKVAVNTLRKEIERIADDTVYRTPPGIVCIQIRFDAICDDMRKIITRAKFDDKESGLKYLLVYCLEKMTEISRL
jgi:hypothetical protein